MALNKVEICGVDTTKLPLLKEEEKKALFERIEDEYDIVIASEAYDEYIKSGRQSRPIEELWKELDI